MKKLMLGNEAVARGFYEAGCKVVSSYPGTPSTEITEYAAKSLWESLGMVTKVLFPFRIYWVRFSFSSTAMGFYY